MIRGINTFLVNSLGSENVARVRNSENKYKELDNETQKSNNYIQGSVH
jgi:hypothetical protein